jgi:hypothetical protein
VLVQADAYQLLLHFQKHEKGRCSHIWVIGRVAQELADVGGEPVLNDGHGVDGGVIRVEKDTPAPPEETSFTAFSWIHRTVTIK